MSFRRPLPAIALLAFLAVAGLPPEEPEPARPPAPRPPEKGERPADIAYQKRRGARRKSKGR